MENSENIKVHSSSNPAGNQFDLELWMPEKFELKMVNASSLNDYEIWGVITSILCNFAVGFAVAAITYTKETDSADMVIKSSQQVQDLLWSVFVIFFILVIASGIFAFHKRRKMNMRAKKINYVASLATESSSE